MAEDPNPLVSNPRPVTVGATRDAFYVGGQYVQDESGKHTMQGQMYVERLTPTSKNKVKPHPLVLVHGATRTGADWLTKPDGGPGWADYFLAHNHQVYLVDVPYRGRSAWAPAVDAVEVVSAEHVQSHFTACAQHGLWPQAALHTQWPGAGVMGDAVFDRFFASSCQMLAGQALQETAAQAALAVLLDRIGEPVVVVAHSNGGGSAYLAADARPLLVRAVVAVEPKGPPFAVSPMLRKPSNRYGVCQAPITYDPPVTDPDVDLVRTTRKADGMGLRDAVLQADWPTPRQLVNMTHIPVLVLTAQASYHAQYDWCSVEYLRQAGVRTEHVKLEDLGIFGNGHMMFMEKNSDDIAAVIEKWITETLPRLEKP